MKKVLTFLLLAALAGLATASQAAAQEKLAKKAKAASTTEIRWHGSVVRSNKDQSTIAVRRGHVERIVHYDTSTQWTKDNKPSDPSAFKDGDSVIVLGKFNDKRELWATRIEIRPPKMVP